MKKLFKCPVCNQIIDSDFFDHCKHMDDKEHRIFMGGQIICMKKLFYDESIDESTDLFKIGIYRSYEQLIEYWKGVFGEEQVLQRKEIIASKPKTPKKSKLIVPVKKKVKPQHEIICGFKTYDCPYCDDYKHKCFLYDHISRRHKDEFEKIKNIIVKLSKDSNFYSHSIHEYPGVPDWMSWDNVISILKECLDEKAYNDKILENRAKCTQIAFAKKRGLSFEEAKEEVKNKAKK